MITDIELPNTGIIELPESPGADDHVPPVHGTGCETPETHNWGCYCAPAGPGSARQVATYLASGAHSHLVAGGQTECLSRLCPADDVLAGVATL